MATLTIYPNIDDTIKRAAELYRMERKGRGPSQERAYILGARLVVELMKNGTYNINQLKQQTLC